MWASEQASCSPCGGGLVQVLDGVLQGLATCLWQQNTEYTCPDGEAAIDEHRESLVVLAQQDHKRREDATRS